MIGAAKRKSISPPGLSALWTILLLVVTLCLSQTRVWGFGITSQPASGVFESVTPSFVGENYDGSQYDALDSLIAAKTGAGAAEEIATGFRGSKGFELSNAPYQPLRNAAGEVNGRLYSGHAFDQMQNRGIMPSVVDNTIQNGVTFPTRAGTTGFFDATNGVRVITNSETGRVITVIRGSP
jgi:hypothetical protein